MVRVELSNHVLYPFVLFFLDTVVISLFVISFLFLCRLGTCLLPDLLTPLSESDSLGLFLCVIYPFHELQSAVTGNPIVSCLMLKQLKVILGPGPCSGPYRDRWKYGSFSVFDGGGPISVPVSFHYV